MDKGQKKIINIIVTNVKQKFQMKLNYVQNAKVISLVVKIELMN